MNLKTGIIYLLSLLAMRMGFSQDTSFELMFGLSNPEVKPMEIMIGRTKFGDQNFSVRQSRPAYRFGGALRVKMGSLFSRVGILYGHSHIDYWDHDLYDVSKTVHVREKFGYMHFPLEVGVFWKFLRIQAGVSSNLPISPIYEYLEIGDYKRRYKGSTFSLRMGSGIDIWKFSIDTHYEYDTCPSNLSILIGESQYMGFARRSRWVTRVGYNF